MKRALFLVLMLLPLLACAPKTPQRAELWNLPPTPAGDTLAAGGWQNAQAVLLLRHAGYVQIGTERLSLSGLLLLDAAHESAKVTATGDFGMTLFSLDIAPHGATRLGPSPLFKRMSSAEAHILRTVRALFLAPAPRPGDACLREGDTVRLYGRRDRGWLSAGFDAASGDLASKEFLGPEAHWRAEYAGYQPVGGTRLPELFRFTDLKAGYVVELHLLDAEVRTP